MSLPDVIWSLFEERLLCVTSAPNTGLFNPYNSVEMALDRPNADKIRRKNLWRYGRLFSAVAEVVARWRGAGLARMPVFRRAFHQRGPA